jgi:hypothetical protein
MKGQSMFSDTDARSGWLRRGPAVLVAVFAAGLLAAVPAFAQAPIDAMFVHSAKSGELGGGRLTLQGGGPRVTWAHRSGRSGVIAVRRMHRLVFSGAEPTATGTLHVAGHRGGQELTFRLTRPRYNAARDTVSYAVRRMKGRLPGRAAGAAGIARQFGAASLSIVGAAPPSGASIQLQMNTYGCPNDPAGLTCFGTVSASGLAGGSEVDSFIAGISQPINSFFTDRNGNLGPTGLAMVCGNVHAVSVSGQAPNGTTVAASGNAPC